MGSTASLVISIFCISPLAHGYHGSVHRIECFPCCPRVLCSMHCATRTVYRLLALFTAFPPTGCWPIAGVVQMGWVEFVADEVVEVGKYKLWARIGSLRELGSHM